MGNLATFVTYMLLCWSPECHCVIACPRRIRTCQVPQSRSSTSASGHWAGWIWCRPFVLWFSVWLGSWRTTPRTVQDKQINLAGGIELARSRTKFCSCTNFWNSQKASSTPKLPIDSNSVRAYGGSIVLQFVQSLQDSILYSEVEDALGRYFRVLDSDMQRRGMAPQGNTNVSHSHSWASRIHKESRCMTDVFHCCSSLNSSLTCFSERFANLHEILRDAAVSWQLLLAAIGFELAADDFWSAFQFGIVSRFQLFPYCVYHWRFGHAEFQHVSWLCCSATSLFDRNMCPKDSKDKAGAAGTSLVGSPPAVLAIHNAGIGLLHEGMREIAVVPWFSFSPDIFRPKLTCAVSFYVRSLSAVLPSIRFKGLRRQPARSPREGKGS